MATEDVVYMLNGLGVESGVDFDAVVDAGEWVVGQLGRSNASKAALASLRYRAAAAGEARPCTPTPAAPTLSLAGRDDEPVSHIGGPAHAAEPARERGLKWE